MALFEQPPETVGMTRSDRIAASYAPIAHLVRPEDVHIPQWSSGQYNQDDIFRAATAYSSVGSIKGAARISGYPETTILYWRDEQRAVWDSILLYIRALQDSNLDNIYSRVILRALCAVEDRIEHGDYKLTKDGQVRVPISGKDLSVIAAIAFDKRQLVRNLPTSIGLSAEITLNSLADKLRVVGATPSPAPIEDIISDLGYSDSEHSPTD